MVRLIMRALALLLLILLLVPVGFSRKLPRKARRALKKADNTASATSSPEAPASSDPAKAGGTEASEAASAGNPAPAQDATNDKKGTNDDYRPAPKFTPILATTGTLGLFTLETADTLPKHGFAFSAFGNKFGRMPGSVTILEFGVDLSYGITDKLNVYAAFDPYGHVHVGCPAS